MVDCVADSMAAMNGDFLQYELSANLLATGLSHDFQRKPLLRRVDNGSTLPGQPWVGLSNEDVIPYFRKSFLVDGLDKALPYLWLVWYLKNARYS